MNVWNEIGKAFVDTMDENNKYNTLEDGFIIGKIISTNPLLVRHEGLEYDEQDLIIPSYFKSYSEEVTIDYGDTTRNVTITYPSKLKINKYIYMYGIEPDRKNCKGNYQRYVVLGVE